MAFFQRWHTPLPPPYLSKRPAFISSVNERLLLHLKDLKKEVSLYAVCTFWGKKKYIKTEGQPLVFLATIREMIIY